jgi:hypothetical protein
MLRLPLAELRNLAAFVELKGIRTLNLSAFTLDGR